MTQGIEFPAYVKLEHQKDASTEAEFVAAVDGMMARASQSVTNFAQNAKQQLDSALSVRRNEAGALDLGVGQIREAAQAQQLRAIAAREVANATLAAAKADGTYTQEQREAVAGARALAAAEEEKATALLRSAAAAEKVQAELDRSQSGVTSLTGSLLALARAETDAANGAQMLAAISANTGLDRIAKSARESAAAFEVLFQARAAQDERATQNFLNEAFALDQQAKSARESAAAFQEMFAAQERNAAGAAQLRAQLDPMFTAQQRFNAAMDQADDLLRAGAITTTEYAKAQQLARDNLREHAQSLFVVEEAQRRGTDAQRNVINSTRASRVAFVQLGQQMQDVTVQAQMGTSAFTIFTQQVPQAAFALSGLADSANKTQARIGAVATFLSGPWGAAIFAATAVLGPFIYSLFRSGEAADESAKSQRSLVEVLNDSTAAIDEKRKALEEYIRTEERSRAVTILSIQAETEAIATNLRAAVAIREKLKATLEETRALANAPGISSTEGASVGFNMEIDKLDRQLAEQNSQIAKLTEAANASVVKSATEIAKLRTDREAFIKTGFDVLREEAKSTITDVNQLADALADLNRRETSALEALRKSSRERKERTRTSKAETLSEVTGEEIARALGTRITSGKRSRADNARVGGGANSYHLIGQAIDIPLTVNGKPLTKQGIREALEPLGVQIKELLGPGDRGHDDHFHIAFARKRVTPDKVAQDAAKAMERQLKEAEKLVNTIAKLGAEFDRYVARSDEAAEAIGNLREESERRLEIEELLTAGREAEASALQAIWQLEDRIGKMTEAQKDDVREIVAAEEARLEVLRRQQDQIGMYLEATRSIRSELESFFAGEGANFGRIARRLQAQYTVEQLFGPALREIDNAVKTQFDRSVDKLATTTDRTEEALADLAAAVSDTAAQVRGGGPVSGPGAVAGVLGGNVAAGFASLTRFGIARAGVPIGVSGGTAGGATGRDSVGGMKPEAYFDLLGKRLTAPLIDRLEQLGIKLPAALKGALGGAVGGYLAAGPVGAVLGGLDGLGIGGKLGAGIGKAFGGAQTGAQTDAIFKSLGIKSSQSGAAIGGAIGSFLPIPGGQIIGSVVGGLLGGALKSTKRGAAIIGGTGDGLGVSGFYGNSGSRKDQAGGFAGDAIEAVNRLAKQLGAQVDASVGKVSIGIREDRLVVDPQGRGYTKTSKFSDLKDFGDDAQGAIAFAVKNLIEDGVLKGLKDSEMRLLKAGDDIEQGLQDVLDFRGVFQRLKAYKDPVGAALDDLDTEFSRLEDLFAKAGASAEEFAALEELYGIERAKAIEEASDRVVGSLRSLLEDINTGDMGLSLRDRRANLLPEFNALRARVDAGDVTAFDKYDEVSRKLLEIERELFGSQAGYFERLFDVRDTASRAVAEQDRLANEAANRDNPFRDNAGDGAKPVVDSIQWLGGYLVDNLGGQLEGLSDAIAALNAPLTNFITARNLGSPSMPVITGQLAY